MTLSKSRAALIGIVCVLMYSILGAAQGVYVGNFIQDVNPIFALFYFSLVTEIALISFCAKQLLVLRKKIHSSLRDIIILNIFTTVAWYGFFFSVRYIEPAISEAVIVAAMPICTFLFVFLLKRANQPSIADKFSICGIFLGVTYLIHNMFQSNSAIEALSFADIGVGVSGAIFAGLALGGATFYSKKLSDVGFEPKEIMLLRFPLLIIVSFAILLVSKASLIPSTHELFIFVVVGIVGFLTPMLLLQIGIKYLEPVKVSIIFSANLIMVYLFQFFDPRLEQSPYSFAGIIWISIFVLIPIAFRFKSKK